MQPLAAIVKERKFDQRKKINNQSVFQLELDLLLNQLELQRLIDGRYRRWFGKVAQTIGVKRLEQLASIARCDGRDPAKLLVFLANRDRTNMSQLQQNQAGNAAGQTA